MLISAINSETFVRQVFKFTNVNITRILFFVDMVATIAGQKELFVKEGSPVVLVCKVVHGKNLPGKKKMLEILVRKLEKFFIKHENW